MTYLRHEFPSTHTHELDLPENQLPCMEHFSSRTQSKETDTAPPFHSRETRPSSRSKRSLCSLGLGPSSSRVQLVAYAPVSSLSPLSTCVEKELVMNAKFDAKDMASQDLDFEDLFTYDKPQKKLVRVVEVTVPTKDAARPPNFSYSYYSDLNQKPASQPLRSFQRTTPQKPALQRTNAP